MKEFIVETDMDLSCVIEFTGAGDVSFKPHGELIRCKDCKFYKPQFNEDGYYTTNCQYSKVAEVNGFCHMARRKEE